MFSHDKKKEKGHKEEIIEQIICEKYNSYYRMAYSYVHNDADASDIVQEGAYKAIKNSRSLKNADLAGTWIYRIMLNEIFRFLKSRKFSSVENDDFPEPQIEDNYENFDLKKALEDMPPKDKAVIQLKYFEELKLEEIADILGENLSTVKSRLYRGLQKLKIKLNE